MRLNISEYRQPNAGDAMDSYLVFMNFPPSNRNIQNVIAKMESGQGSSKKDALLVNCHFDSVPQSPGASDDAVREGPFSYDVRKF